MKKWSKLLWVFTLLFFISCSEDENDENEVTLLNVTLNFSHNWDGEEVTNADFNTLKYTNANGEQMSIELLRYLISNITFKPLEAERIAIDGYNLVDVTNNSGLSMTINDDISAGTYEIAFTFGFDNEDNSDGAYLDLNSASWNVPMMLGGGYHYMQLEGKYLATDATEVGYQYHAIRAVDITGDEPRFQDTFFEVNLGTITITEDTTITVDMNIAEWFKNPNQWDLNVLGQQLMPNFNAQVMMFENGQNVFQLAN
ncbi:MAG: MbnP family protein [Bacteroidota bacterium]